MFSSSTAQDNTQASSGGFRVWPSSNGLVQHQETKLLDLKDEDANKQKSSEMNHNQWQKPHCQIRHQYVYLMGPPCPRKGDRLDNLRGFSNTNT